MIADGPGRRAALRSAGLLRVFYVLLAAACSAEQVPARDVGEQSDRGLTDNSGDDAAHDLAEGGDATDDPRDGDRGDAGQLDSDSGTGDGAVEPDQRPLVPEPCLFPSGGTIGIRQLALLSVATSVQPYTLNGVAGLIATEREGLVVFSSTTTADPGGRPEWALLLDIRDRVLTEGPEAGLFAVALHPAFPEDPRLFLTYTRGTAESYSMLLSAFTVDASGTVSPSSEEVLLEIPHLPVPPADPTHHGGGIRFGPDGFLYLAVGDGGGFETSERLEARSLSSYRGKILRLDVDSRSGDRAYGIPADNPFVGVDAALTEIYALGLRNPWRFSFDEVTGDLWVGDVGDSAREEINRVVAGGDYGWPLREGTACARLGSPCEDPSAIDPFVELDREDMYCIVGGVVYRGAIEELREQYIFADCVQDNVWALDPVTREARIIVSTGQGSTVSIDQDADGEVVISGFAAVNALCTAEDE